MNKRDRDWERRRDGVWAAPVGIPAGQKSGKGRWCLSGRLSSVPGWRSGWTLQVSREETPDWKSEVWKGSGRRRSSIRGRWETETLCTRFTVELHQLCEKKKKKKSPSRCENSLISSSAKEEVWENYALLALWIANYNIKPFVRNLSIEFYFKWMLQMTPLHSTLHIPSFFYLQIQDVWKEDRFWCSSPYNNTLLIIVSRGEKCRASQLKNAVN